ncbi:MAG TPA: NADH-quinone oxidoreductase subunit N [Acidobacteriaceae bacterium]|nr:NADH-quinone oxidoreductase subunit N [Acidobacteriaceae bacterium]
MIAVSYTALLHLLLPEVIVVVTALLALAADLLISRTAPMRTRFTTGAVISAIGCLGAITQIVRDPQHANVFNGTLVINPGSQLVQIAILILTALIAVLSIESSFTSHVGEYFAVTLFATTGMMLLVSSENVLLIFLSLELLSLSLYVLAAFNKRSSHSAEAALKYFLFGGMSAAFLLFGLSLLYGLSNSTNLLQIARAIKSPPLDPLWAAAIVMIVLGLGFKVAAVPFHFWAPDVYEGAPSSSAALIASSAKVAGFVIFYQVMVIGFAGAGGSGDWKNYTPGWVPIVAVVAAMSMVLGNLVAITQTSVRRLLAYSAIAQAGYILLGLVSHTEQSFDALLYYAVTYALTVIGAFGAVAIVEEQLGGEKLSDFAGLSRRAPLLSFCMLIFMLSLAGIPPLAGFFGKFFLFASALAAGQHPLGLLWLVVLAIAMSTVSLYYYLQVLKRIYIAEPPSEANRIHVPIVSQLALCAIALSILLLGCAPNLFLAWLHQPIRIAQF